MMVETKVIAATAGTAFGAAFSSVLVWLMGVVIWGASGSAANASKAVAAVPPDVVIFVSMVVSGGCALVSGWWAPHTFRSVAPPPVPQVLPVATLAETHVGTSE